MTKKFSFIALALLSFSLISCATKVSAERQRPAELDLNGANSISVLPLQTSPYDSDEFISFMEFFFYGNDNDPKREIAQYFTTGLQDELLNSEYLTVIGSKRVEEAIRNGNDIPCDVYLTGYITNWDNKIVTDTRKDSEGERYYIYTREVNFTIVYQVIDAETGRIISNKRKYISDSSISYERKHELPEPFDLVKSDLNSLIRTIMRQLQPYYETKTISLLKVKVKNPKVDYADSLIKAHDYATAKDVYLELYNSTGSFEAGFNAASIMQILGDFEDAEKLMSKLYEQSGNKKASKALSDIRKEMSLTETFKVQQEMRNFR